MAPLEVLQWDPFAAVAEIARQTRESRPSAVRFAAPAAVPACSCSGLCRCGTLVPYLLQQQIERDCEFFREVH